MSAWGSACTGSDYPSRRITFGEGSCVYMNGPILSLRVLSFRACICVSGQDNRCGRRMATCITEAVS